MGVLDYLRTRLPDSVSFSEDSYILKDPFGSEIDGSGLMCYTADLVHTGRFIMNVLLSDDNTFSNPAFRQYLLDATSLHSPTIQTSQTPDESLGYGYQFWMIRGGFCMYGMGGQYVLFYPKYDLIISTTANLLNIKGGERILQDIIYDTLCSNIDDFSEYVKETAPFRNIHPLYPTMSQQYDVISGRAINPNDLIRSVSVDYDEHNGTVIFECMENTYRIKYSFDQSEESVIDDNNQEISCKALWSEPDTLYLPVYLTGEEVGSIHISIHFSDAGITLYIRKNIEMKYYELPGFHEAVTLGRN
jgi:hypothetical protein